MSEWPQTNAQLGDSDFSALKAMLVALADAALAFEKQLENATPLPEACLTWVAKWHVRATHLRYYLATPWHEIVAQAPARIHALELDKVSRHLERIRNEILTSVDGAFNTQPHAPSPGEVKAEKFPPRVLAQLEAFDEKRLGEHATPVHKDEISARSAAEQKDAPKERKLESFLAVTPRTWLVAIATVLNLEVPRKQGDDFSARLRVAIREHLLAQENLTSRLTLLPDEAQKLFYSIAGAPQAMRSYKEVCKEVGSDEVDGLDWLLRPPSTQLSRLRRRGLAFVMRHEKQSFVFVPVDLAKLAKVIHG